MYAMTERTVAVLLVEGLCYAKFCVSYWLCGMMPVGNRVTQNRGNGRPVGCTRDVCAQ